MVGAADEDPRPLGLVVNGELDVELLVELLVAPPPTTTRALVWPLDVFVAVAALVGGGRLGGVGVQPTTRPRATAAARSPNGLTMLLRVFPSRDSLV